MSNALNHFTPSHGATNAIAQAEQQRAIAEVQAALMIARANPRDQKMAMDRVLNACTRPSLAEVAVYSYAKGGSNVSGPSIRLAEAMAQNWGNMQFGMRELSQSDAESTVQSYAWDVETNTRREITFQVPHIRHTKRGVTKITDPREVYELIANQGARRLRACILSVIPGDVTEAAVAQCEQTMHARADTSPEAIAKLVQSFTQFDVTKGQIEKRIQRRLDAIQPAQIVNLRKIFASMRDGMSTAQEWFDKPDASDTAERPAWAQEAWRKKLPTILSAIQGGQTLESALAWLRGRAPITPEQEQELLDEVAKLQQPAQPEQPAQADAPQVDHQKLEADMQSAPSLDKLYELGGLLDAVNDEAARMRLTEIFDARIAELEATQ